MRSPPSSDSVVRAGVDGLCSSRSMASSRADPGAFEGNHPSTHQAICLFDDVVNQHRLFAAGHVVHRHDVLIALCHQLDDNVKLVAPVPIRPQLPQFSAARQNRRSPKTINKL